MRHRLGLATRTQISVCKSPFPSADTAVSMFRAKTVQQRPLLPREVVGSEASSQAKDCETKLLVISESNDHVNTQYLVQTLE